MHPLINAYLTLRRLERLRLVSGMYEEMRQRAIREAYRLIHEILEEDPHLCRTWMSS